MNAKTDSETTIGYDYGTKPKVIVVSDIEFLDLLKRGDFTAVGYSKVPQFGLLVNAPLLVIIFNDREAGRECFTHFKGWSDASGDGDAVGTGFIEFENGDYGLCIYPENKHLIERSIPEIHRSEVEPIIMVVGYLKVLQQRSGYYDWFKSAVKTSPFVLAPGTMEGGPMLDLAIRKQEVRFYYENDIPENTMEAALMRSRKADGEGELRRPIPPEMMPSAQDIYERRMSQLRRFFPVTLECLRFNSHFIRVQKRLIEEGYREWQILQAVCNMALKSRTPQLFDTSKVSSGNSQESEAKMKILDYLLTNFEDISETFPSLGRFSSAKLRKQIEADEYDLLQYVAAPDVPKIPTNEIRSELTRYGLV